MTDSYRRTELRTAPTGVTDPLLWHLAVDVAAAHQADANGHCTNLQCARVGRGECPPARLARYALHRAYATALRPMLPPRDTRATATQPAIVRTGTPTAYPSRATGRVRTPLPGPRPHPIATAA